MSIMTKTAVTRLVTGALLPGVLAVWLMGCTAQMYSGGLLPLEQVAIIREGKGWNSETEILEVDGQRVGDFRPAVEVLPGSHRMRMRFFRSTLVLDRMGDPVTETFPAEAGHTYEIRGRPAFGGARWRAEIVDITESLANPPPLARTIWGAIPRWVGSRLLDLFDVGQVNITGGLGTGINIHPTRLLQIGMGSFTGVRVGWMGRRFPFKFDAETGAGLSVLSFQARRPRDFWRVGAWAHLVIVGVEVGIDPPELADLVCGLVGADLSNDDLADALPGEVVLLGRGH